MTIRTRNLQLIPIAPQHLLALIEGECQFEAQFGWPAAEGLRDFFVSNEVSPLWIAELRAATEPNPWVFGFALVHEESHSVIGTASFKGEPDDKGMVEIAYGIAPDYQGRGYASEAAAALVEFAFTNGKVQHILAHTLTTNYPSMRVLEKCGFKPLGQVIDLEDGLVLQWERTRQPAE